MWLFLVSECISNWIWNSLKIREKFLLHHCSHSLWWEHFRSKYANYIETCWSPWNYHFTFFSCLPLQAPQQHMDRLSGLLRSLVTYWARNREAKISHTSMFIVCCFLTPIESCRIYYEESRFRICMTNQRFLHDENCSFLIWSTDIALFIYISRKFSPFFPCSVHIP